MITYEYELDEICREPHNYIIYFNDGLEECEWWMRVEENGFYPFSLEVGLGGVCGRFPLFEEHKNFLLTKGINISEKRLSHKIIIEYIVKNLTRELAFSNKQNYQLFNFDALAANGTYEFLLGSGITNKEIISEIFDSELLFKDLFIYESLFKRITKDCSKDELINLYRNLGISFLLDKAYNHFLIEEIRLQVLDELISAKLIIGPNQFLDYDYRMKLLKFVKDKQKIFNLLDFFIAENFKEKTAESLQKCIDFYNRLNNNELKEEADYIANASFLKSK